MSERSSEAKQSVRKRRQLRFAVSLNSGIGLLLAVVLVGLVNYLSYRHYQRYDWSRSHFYSLSDKTLGLLSSLTNDVEIIVFLAPSESTYEDTHNLLREYEYSSKRIKVEYVDPYRDPARTEQLAAKFDVQMLDADVIVFDAGGRQKFVRSNDLVDKDFSMNQLNRGAIPIAFKGEQAFSSAIQEITEGEKPVVYFLQGHGERDTESFDRFAGFSEISKQIEQDNVEIKTLVLGESQVIPEDCDALIIAGPETKLFQPEADLIAQYLEANGRLLLLADASTTTGLEGVLEDWGVRLADDVVVDGTRTLTGRELFLTDFGAHPITHSLKGVTCVMYFPRSVMPLVTGEEDGPDRPKATVLAQSSPAGWAESALEQSPMQFDPQVDSPGPVSVAVAVERGAGKGIDVEIRPTRLVVMGDSDFLTNGASSGGNVDLFLSSLNWLLEREQLLAIAAKPIEEVRLVMSQQQLTYLFWLVVLGLPGAVAVLGLLVWWRRRS